MDELKRRNLPHLYFNDGMYFVTARLAGTLPVSLINNLSEILNKNITFDEFRKHFVEYDHFLDNRQVSDYKLTDFVLSSVLSDCIFYPDRKDYNLICFTIMPTHFHFAFELLPGNKGISKIMQSIKGVSARRINKALNRSGKLWQDESYDRWIRNDVELYFVIKYILENPVKAGLANNWNDWKFTYCNPNYLIL